MDSNNTPDARIIVICLFILSQPGWKKAFGGECSKQKLVNTVLHYHKTRRLLIFSNVDGNITGVIFFTPNVSEGLVSVEHIVGVNGTGFMKAAFYYWAQHYPTCAIYAKRHGKTKCYNPARHLVKRGILTMDEYLSKF